MVPCRCAVGCTGTVRTSAKDLCCRGCRRPFGAVDTAGAVGSGRFSAVYVPRSRCCVVCFCSAPQLDRLTEQAVQCNTALWAPIDRFCDGLSRRGRERNAKKAIDRNNRSTGERGERKGRRRTRRASSKDKREGNGFYFTATGNVGFVFEKQAPWDWITHVMYP